MRRLVNSEQIIPGYLEFVLASYEKFIGERPDVLKAFLGAWKKTVEFIAANESDAAKIWGTAAGLEAKVVEEGLKNLPKGSWTTTLNVTGMKRTVDTMIEFKQLQKAPDWSKLVVQEFLDPADRVQF